MNKENRIKKLEQDLTYLREDYKKGSPAMRGLLKTEANDSNRVKLYSELGYFYQEASNFDSAYFSYQKSNILAKELKDSSTIIDNQFNIAKIYGIANLI